MGRDLCGTEHFLMLQMHASHKTNVDRNVGKGGAITNSKF